MRLIRLSLRVLGYCIPAIVVCVVSLYFMSTLYTNSYLLNALMCVVCVPIATAPFISWMLQKTGANTTDKQQSNSIASELSSIIERHFTNSVANLLVKSSNKSRKAVARNLIIKSSVYFVAFMALLLSTAFINSILIAQIVIVAAFILFAPNIFYNVLVVDRLLNTAKHLSE